MRCFTSLFALILFVSISSFSFAQSAASASRFDIVSKTVAVTTSTAISASAATVLTVDSSAKEVYIIEASSIRMTVDAGTDTAYLILYRNGVAIYNSGSLAGNAADRQLLTPAMRPVLLSFAAGDTITAKVATSSSVAAVRTYTVVFTLLKYGPRIAR